MGGTCLDLPVRRSWGENVLAASKWRSWLKPAMASSDWAACQRSGAGKCFLFVPNSVLAAAISSHSAHGARTQSLAFIQGIAQSGKKLSLSHASPTPKLLTPPLSTPVAFSGVLSWQRFTQVPCHNVKILQQKLCGQISLSKRFYYQNILKHTDTGL